MNRMKRNITNLLRILLGPSLGLALVTVASAQQPSPSPTPKKSTAAKTKTPAEAGEDMGDYTVISSIEVGYRGLKVVGDNNKYRSDLNYKAGPRLFDSSFLIRSKDGKGSLFDSLLVTSTGWGGDPYGNLRLSAEKPKWYRFDATYRKFKYFRFLNNLANPNWIFSPASFSVPPNPVTGEHGYNTNTEMGDFDLSILPKSEGIRFNIGYSPERYSGPASTNYHVGGNDFNFQSQLRSRANDFRVGADGKVGPIDFSFLQGFRRFRDDSFTNLGATPGINLNPAATFFTSFNRNEPTRGHINYTRFSAHTLAAKKLDMTARIIYSMATSDSVFTENLTGRNFNTRITGLPAAYNPPNTLNLGQYNITGRASRPNTIADLGVTYLATDKLRISNTFRVETFQINGGDRYTAAFFITSGAGVPQAPLIINNGGAGFASYRVTKYRKVQDTIEGDYQISAHYSMHFGYRYASRRIEEIESGYAINTNVPTLVTPADDVETNHTNAFFGGFKARPVKGWTVFFDAEHGTADNVFTRIGNYDYTNIRAKSRYAPNRKVSWNVTVITRDNANPSEIAGVLLTDFGVDTKTRLFTSSVDVVPSSKVSFSVGINHNWINSDAVIDYFYNSIRHPVGHSLYFSRNNFFFFDTVAQLHPRVSLYATWRINKDTGQGHRVSDPTGTPGTLITSYPMSFQSPEVRLTFKINRQVDWNVGYQYYSYLESPFVGPRPQNYHAHMPYTSLRFYIGRKE
jgi:hypothetical protein